MREFPIYDENGEFLAVIRMSDEDVIKLEKKALDCGEAFEDVLLAALYEQIKGEEK